jgi:hypothetical protein
MEVIVIDGDNRVMGSTHIRALRPCYKGELHGD